MTAWHSYPKIYSIDHAQVREILSGPVVVQEKVDGSQISFGVFDGVLRIRSRGKEMIVDQPEKQFSAGVLTIKAVAHKLPDGYMFSGEYLQKPKHNVLSYARIPKGHIALFDCRVDEEDYLTPAALAAWADILGFDVVPLVYHGMLSMVDGPAQLKAWSQRESFLGGPAEGIVVKNHAKFDGDKKAMMAKIVTDDFKEVHGKEWKKMNPGNGDIVQQLIDRYKAEGRYAKAVQHLREAGKLTDSPKDIGPLIREIQEDVKAECAAEIQSILFDWAWPKIARAIVGPVPVWYQNRLHDQAQEAGDVPA